jgi:aspartyl-tRNA(Asn)/glutamyl-tRNA(Gln) amidotransferase subunit B
MAQEESGDPLSNADKKYEAVIGLEVHLQLRTKTKIFSNCPNVYGHEANSQTDPVSLGLPGTLPVLNKKALEYGIKVGLALNCAISDLIKFDRKNYYYPDLPKGYQISQYDHPIAYDGHIMIPVGDGKLKRVGITRAHLEEDAGKLIHDDEANCSLVDYNRTGTPLMEIVSEPDLRSAQEAYDYLTMLKLTLSYLDVSDCDMEKGSLRCDANVSIREPGAEKFGTKTEIKNMNSFRAVKAGIEYELERQKAVLAKGERIVQETRLWNEAKSVTIAMRSKEEAHDYRYFPDPDLVPFMVEQSEIEAVRRSLPEMPLVKIERFMNRYGLNEYDANVLIQDKHLADFFEACVKLYDNSKKICNWIGAEVLKELNERKKDIRSVGLKPSELTALIQRVENGTLSNLAGKEVLKLLLDTGQSVDKIIEDKGLTQVSDDGALEEIVDAVIKDNARIADEIRAGNEKAVGFLVGQSMKKSQGKANPKRLGEIIKRRLTHG